MGNCWTIIPYIYNSLNCCSYYEDFDGMKSTPKMLPPRIDSPSTRMQSADKKVKASFYTTQEWKQFVRDILRERGRVCQKCHRMYDDMFRPIRVYLDHIIEIEDGGALFDRRNVQVLCGSCHTQKTLDTRKARSRKEHK